MTRDRGYRVHVETKVPRDPDKAWCRAGKTLLMLVLLDDGIMVSDASTREREVWQPRLIIESEVKQIA
jgi:hypothetical protein